MGKRFKCRIAENLILPCNYVMKGLCGSDGKPCRVEEQKESEN